MPDERLSLEWPVESPEGTVTARGGPRLAVTRKTGTHMASGLLEELAEFRNPKGEPYGLLEELKEFRNPKGEP